MKENVVADPWRTTKSFPLRKYDRKINVNGLCARQQSDSSHQRPHINGRLANAETFQKGNQQHERPHVAKHPITR